MPNVRQRPGLLVAGQQFASVSLAEYAAEHGRRFHPIASRASPAVFPVVGLSSSSSIPVNYGIAEVPCPRCKQTSKRPRLETVFVKGFGCRPTRRREMHWGRRPEASREGTRGTVGRPRMLRSSMGIWALQIGCGIRADAPRPAQWRRRCAGAGHHRRAELARRCPSMLHPQGAHPI